MCIDFIISIFSPQALHKLASANVTCSENVAYDTTENALQISTPANMTCSENVAYATVTRTREDTTNTSTSHTPVYDEVQLEK